MTDTTNQPTNIPNLDSMGSTALRTFANRYACPTRSDAANLVGGKIRQYTRIVRDLANYASNKATAMECRERGEIQAALIYEGIADRIYSKIPPDLRW